MLNSHGPEPRIGALIELWKWRGRRAEPPSAAALARAPWGGAEQPRPRPAGWPKRRPPEQTEPRSTLSRPDRAPQQPPVGPVRDRPSLAVFSVWSRGGVNEPLTIDSTSPVEPDCCGRRRRGRGGRPGALDRPISGPGRPKTPGSAGVSNPVSLPPISARYRAAAARDSRGGLISSGREKRRHGRCCHV